MSRETIELEVMQQFFSRVVNDLIERTADYVEVEEDLQESYKEIDELEDRLEKAEQLIKELTKDEI